MMVRRRLVNLSVAEVTSDIHFSVHLGSRLDLWGPVPWRCMELKPKHEKSRTKSVMSSKDFMESCLITLASSKSSGEHLFSLKPGSELIFRSVLGFYRYNFLFLFEVLTLLFQWSKHSWFLLLHGQYSLKKFWGCRFLRLLCLTVVSRCIRMPNEEPSAFWNCTEALKDVWTRAIRVV